MSCSLPVSAIPPSLPPLPARPRARPQGAPPSASLTSRPHKPAITLARAHFTAPSLSLYSCHSPAPFLLDSLFAFDRAKEWLESGLAAAGELRAGESVAHWAPVPVQHRNTVSQERAGPCQACGPQLARTRPLLPARGTWHPPSSPNRCLPACPAHSLPSFLSTLRCLPFWSLL